MVCPVQIDEYLASQGHQVKRLSMAQLEEQPAQVTAEDMAGWSKVRQTVREFLDMSVSELHRLCIYLHQNYAAA